MKKYDLFFGYFGNGCSVSNRAVMEHGDYKKVCHISDDGKITVYDHSAPADVMERIRAYAEQMKKRYTEKQEADRIARQKHAEWLKNRMNGTAEPEEQTGTEEPKETEKYIAVTESAGKIKIFDKFILQPGTENYKILTETAKMILSEISGICLNRCKDVNRYGFRLYGSHYKMIILSDSMPI